MIDTISNFDNGQQQQQRQQQNSHVQDNQSQQEKDVRFKTLADIHKSLLIRLVSTYEDTAELKTEIMNLNENNITSFSLNDFMKIYEKAVIRDNRRKAKNEKLRVGSVLQSTVVNKYITLFIFLFF